MKLSKSQEDELLKVYDTWWHSYLNGDVKTYDSFLDDDFRFVGSTGSEEFLNKRDTTAFFEETAEQLSGNAKLENVIRTIEPLEGMVLITDLADTYIRSGAEWVYYARFRFTSMLRNTKNGWRFFYQHFSTPDLKAQEGETIGIEKISAENLELRNAIKRRTAELELKNRDLEIEASLERVRARTMAMQQSHELSDVATVLFKELNELVENLWTCGFVLCEKDRPEDEWWLSTEEGFVPPLFLPNVGDATHHNMYEAWKNGAPYHTEQLEGDALQEHYNWLMTIPLAKAFFDDMLASGLEMPAWQKLHCAYFSYGYLVMITQVPCPEEAIFKRFAKVFDQTYTRFLDLQKAEAQVREAKIEAALEKVRARSMAMHKADELADTAMMLFAQVTELGIPLRSCGFLIMDEEKQVMEDWSANIDEHGNSTVVTGTLAYDQHALLKDVVATWRRGDPYIIAEAHGADLQKYYEAVTTKESTTKEIESKVLAKATSEYTNSFYFEYGMMYVLTPEPISEHEINMLMRFAGVFKLTYRRFLDLQKAEAQVKQAKIESALERVRSQSLSMHRSKDMQQVADAIFSELQNLGLKMSAVGMLGQIKENSDYEVWMGGSGYSEPLLIPFTDSTQVQRDYNVIMKERPALFARTYSGAIKKEYIDFLMGSNTFPKNLAKEMRESDAFSTSISFSKNSGIQIARYSGEAYDHEENEILKNFAQVFEQAYIRFLDLQRAEAQAREAEIELALERVRARTMAMQSSDELAEVATVLFQQVKELGIPQWTCGFNIWEIGDEEFTFYPGGPDGEILPSCQVPLFEHPIFAQFDESRRRGDELLVYEKKGKMGADHYKYMHSLPGIGDMLQGMLDMGLEFPEFQIDHLANFAYGNLIFITYEPFPEMHNVFIRFAKVFEQTYTRFLDLQKAEAQAREAQIQLSLERVRARSLAMKSSDELHEVLSVLFRQFDILGINPVNVFLSLFDREERTTTYRASGKSGKRIPGKQVVGLDSLEAWTALFDKWENDSSDSVEVIYYPKEIVPKIFALFKETFSAMPRVDRMTADDFPNGGYSILGYTPFGYLGYDHTRKPTAEEKDILTRFCTEFGRVYQRFLDIQKAEAQAREAQIEAALEKVRSTSLAMHKSEELPETARVLFEQFASLGKVPDRIGICIVNEEVNEFELWGTDQIGGQINHRFNVSMEEATVMAKMYQAWKEGKASHIIDLSGQDLQDWIKYTREKVKLPVDDTQIKDRRVQQAAFFSQGMILFTSNDPAGDETMRLLVRFAKVFDQAYVRFLDLQKAEAQAREAQIETALERVRSRSLAMHTTGELQEVTKLVAELLQELGVVLDPQGVQICTYPPDSKDVIHWTYTPDEERSIPYFMPYFKNQIWDEAWRSKNSGASFFSKTFPVAVKNRFLKTIFTREDSDYRLLPQEFKDWLLASKKYTLSFAWAQNSALLIPNNDGIAPDKEQQQVLIRFAKVFEQAYIRFLDLQKAEAQAREAEIELALERVRARTMAMQHSTELADTSALLFQQIQILGVSLWSCGFNIWEKEDTVFTSYMGSPDGSLLKGYKIPLTEEAAFIRFKESRNRGDKLFIDILEGDALETHYQYFQALPGIKEMFEEEDQAGRSLPSFQIHHLANFSHGNLMFITYEHCPEAHDIFIRFAKVFEQTYTRFLDLEKAEAQAREAQIEVSLERVRSRAMAMHHTDELTDVLCVLFDQFDLLGINPVLTHLTLMDEENETFSLRITTTAENRIVAEQKIDVNAIDAWKNSFEHWKNSDITDIDCIDYTPEQIPLVWGLLQEVMDALPEGHRIYPEDFPEGLYTTQGRFKFGYIGFNHNRPSTEEERSIVIRFAKEFGRTYQRFLDLQKAEAQARESQIEAALERLRAQSMAMHKTEELSDVVKSLFEELRPFGFAKSGCELILVDEKNELLQFWNSNPVLNKIQESFNIPKSIHPFFQKQWKAWKNQVPRLTITMEGEEKERFDQLIFTRTDFKHLPEDVKKFISHHGVDVFSLAIMKHGLLEVVDAVPISEDMFTVLERFAKVFEQSYTRFLDLQKAESQAREAQTEWALERVRSRTMAMQKSEELKEVIQVVYEQFLQLNIHIEHAGFIIDYKARDDMHIWLADRHEIQSEITFPYFDCAYWNSFKEAKEKGLDFFVTHLTFEEKNKFYQDLFDLIPGVPEESIESYLSYPGLAGSTVLLDNVGLYIENFAGIPYSEEENKTLMRFGKVFQQTYTRFLDLQKAESQARQAEINLAVERVRAKALAMHKSEDIMEVVAKLKDEVMNLNIPGVVAATIFLSEGDNKIRMWDLSSIEKLEEGYEVPLDIIFTLKKKDPHLYVKRVWENPGNYFVEIQDEKGFKRILAWLREHHKNEVADEVVAYIESAQLKRLYHAAKKLNNGKLCIDLLDPPLDEMESILTKMGAAFDLAYKRFEDLQKSENQAREAKIEAALERVRSKTMAMHNSQDVGATVGAMFDELVKLGIDKSVRCGIGILDHTKPMELWTASSNPDGEVILNIGFLDMSMHPLLKGVFNAWKKKETNFTYELKGNDVLKYFTALNESPDYHFHVDLKSLPKKTIHNSFPFSEGTLYAFSPQPLTEEEEQIFKRFSGVFAQTYTRYLDLLKAEAQAREAEIEAALERVRSQTMAMHNSQDVGKTVVTFFDEVMKLGLNKSIRCGIGILEDREKMETWSATSNSTGDVDLQVGLLDMKRHPLIKGLETAWKNKEDGYSYELIGEDVVRYYEQLVEEPDYPFHVDLENLSDIEYHKSFFFSSGIIFTFTKTPISEEAAAVLKRFAGVFGQTYRRFLDLQKAEAQAKEAQIEAALEKVRSRTMAMQASSELQEAANVLFLEIQALGINAWSAGYNILSDDKTTSTCWMSSEGELQDPFPLYYTEEASFIEMGTFLKSQDDFFVQELQGKELERHYDYMKSLPELKDTFKHIQDVGLSLPTYQVNHLCKFNQGYLLFITYEAVPEAHDIFKRFTKVFEQTYTRFLDLKKAENQSKEAQIELALERVRASTMAMHKSEQLAGTAEVLFDQFDLLGIIPDRISIAIFNEKKRIFELWATDQNGTFVNHAHDFSIDEPTCMEKTYQAWKEGKETFVVDLKGAELKRWIRFVKEDAKMELDESRFKGRRVQHCAFFSQGYLLLSSHLPIKDEMLQLLLRFAKVFQQTYTRFLDLQKAETQAREAIKRASVDRVRAEIASMRTTTDLKRITPLVWNELTTLNVPFIRCGVFIMDEEQQQVQTHLSTPDGKAIASFNLPFENTEPLTELLPHWRKNEIYKDHWDESAFIESTRILMQRGAIASSETYVTEKQPTNLYLHFLPFLQGMLYVGSEVSLSEDELNLVQNLAEAFSTAYSRYEDFNKLELANKKIEKTLVDLKQTQTQLIQSEKMASLGELTAGIAHEIQNPLNFVNNFSEVSHELMKEMLEELEKGDLDEAREISHDIEQNLEKINHHGKRASDIVKGMLEHSRKGDGKKELTDINKLADEYLRLAYHGLRAKDKSFNADFSEDFDQDLPLIEAIPQDMGRVLLNLISNAFYAVSAKDKQGLEGYKPTVVVSTKKVNDLIEIKVKDNGSGVSKSIRDKIFQPFFTTKPTGQGTGLGLSMSYDIVTKGHGGSLEVISTEGEGSEFIINLNITA